MAWTRKNGKHKGKILNTQRSVNALVWTICDIRRRPNCAGAIGCLEYSSVILLHAGFMEGQVLLWGRFRQSGATRVRGQRAQEQVCGTIIPAL